MSEAVLKFSIGDRVCKVNGDYTHYGEVRGVVVTKAGKVLYVVEFDFPTGLLHIYSPAQLERVED